MNHPEDRESVCESCVSEPRLEDERLIRAVHEYLAALEQGNRPERAGFLARHADVAEHLSDCLDGLEFVYGVGQQLSHPAARSPGKSDFGMPGLQLESPLGDYHVVREIGRGGMGVVYEAVQLSLGRRVALKILPFATALDDRQLQRFKNEAQAAALLHHQSIVPVYGVGCERGLHYYAMQYIQGQTLAALIEELRGEAGFDMEEPTSAGSPGASVTGGAAPVREGSAAGNETGTPVAPPIRGTVLPSRQTSRPAAMTLLQFRSIDSSEFVRTVARLAIQAAEALEHAHQMGIIHRDIKPSNILVDVRENLWITDFGLARVQGEGKLTVTGDLVGTLRYMSPEQASADPLLLDHRTDLYSLGATLYELLTLRLLSKGQDRESLLREITGVEPASMRSLNRAIPRDFETILLKALAKNPAERYATAQEVADDCRRFLENKTIRARRPTPWQSVKKWARRNGALVWSAALSSAAVLILTVVGLALSNASIAHKEKEKAVALAEAESNLGLARTAVDEMYTQVADEISIVPQMQPYQRALLQKALRFYREFRQRRSTDPIIHRETARAVLRVAEIEFTLGQRRLGEQGCREAIAAIVQTAGESPREPQMALLLGEAYVCLSGILNVQGRPQQAEATLRQGVALYERLVSDYPDVPEHRWRLATSYHALCGFPQQSSGDAEKRCRAALELSEQLVSRWPGVAQYERALIVSHHILGNSLAAKGQPERAEKAFRQTIELVEKAGKRQGRYNYAQLKSSAEARLALMLSDCGRDHEAEEAYRRAVAQAEHLVTQYPDVPVYVRNLAQHQVNFGRLLARTGHSSEAAAARRSARELIGKLTAEFPDEVNADGDVADVSTLREIGDWQAAKQAVARVLERARKRAEEDPAEPSYRQELAAWHSTMGSVLMEAGQPREAAGAFRHALATVEDLVRESPREPLYRYQWARRLNYLGIALRCQPGEGELAVQVHRRAIALCIELMEEFPDQLDYRGELLRSCHALGLMHELAGQWTDAERVFQQGVAACRPVLPLVGHATYRDLPASLHNDLAWLKATRPELQDGDPSEALELARKAVELDPKRRGFWNTLGLANYRAGDWNNACAALERSMALHQGGDGFDWFLLAMVHWQRGDKDQARRWYESARQWMAQKQPRNEELGRFRAEAEALLLRQGKS